MWLGEGWLAPRDKDIHGGWQSRPPAPSGRFKRKRSTVLPSFYPTWSGPGYIIHSWPNTTTGSKNYIFLTQVDDVNFSIPGSISGWFQLASRYNLAPVGGRGGYMIYHDHLCIYRGCPLAPHEVAAIFIEVDIEYFMQWLLYCRHYWDMTNRMVVCVISVEVVGLIM